MRLRLFSRAAAYRMLALFAVLGGLGTWAWFEMIRMPGNSHRGPLPPLTQRESELVAELREHVQKLAGDIGERNLRRPKTLAAAADYVEVTFAAAGYVPERQSFMVDGDSCDNLDAEVRGGERASEIVVVGAHYDSVSFAPGANDNGSGAAAMLALARTFAKMKLARTLRFVAFANEEPPYFQNATMGSLVYAKRCKDRGERIVAMISLETIGWYSDAKGSQKYPPPLNAFYPSTGDFIAFVGDRSSADLVRDVVARFRTSSAFPSEGAALPAGIPGVGWSDHWSFWQYGYPGVMVTDTAPFRYPHYHTAKDTPEKLDYDRMARVVAGIERVVAEIANAR